MSRSAAITWSRERDKADADLVTSSRYHCDNGAKFDGFVYLISWGEEGNPVKIGWAKQPYKRLNELQTGHPESLRIIGVFPGSRPLEKIAHKAAGERYRLSGEWFEWAAAKRLVRESDIPEMTYFWSV